MIQDLLFNNILIYFSIIIIGVVSLLLTQYVFLKYSILDKINNRSSHTTIATRSGGVSIFLSVLIVSFFCYLNDIDLFEYSLIVPLSLLLVVGLYDDVYKLDFKLKFIFQIIAAKIMIDNGFIIDNLHGVLWINEMNRVLAQLFTIFIIVAVINSINFIDGIDGLGLSVVLIFIGFFEFFSSEITPFINLSLLIFAASIGLFYFNFKKNKKIFLGDSGSLLLGGVVSLYMIYILSQDYVIKPDYDIHKILFVLSILPFPIIDMVRIVMIRIKNKKSPFEADKNHLHHLILSKTKSHFKTTFLIILFNIILIFAFQIIQNFQ